MFSVKYWYVGGFMSKINDLLDFRMVSGNDIPTIPLYMDQVTGYLDEIFETLKRNNEEKILTKTMINNYVKSQIIKNPEKKKYTSEQIKTLMMIYMLKNSIQMHEIKDFLNVEEQVHDLYDEFIEIDTFVRENLSKQVQVIKDRSKMEQIIYFLLTSNVQKKYAELLLDELIGENTETTE